MGNKVISVIKKGIRVDLDLEKVIQHEDGKWTLHFSDGRKEEFTSEQAAQERERQVNYFKNQKKYDSIQELIKRVREIAKCGCETKNPGEVAAQPNPEGTDEKAVQIENNLAEIEALLGQIEARGTEQGILTNEEIDELITPLKVVLNSLLDGISGEADYLESKGESDGK